MTSGNLFIWEDGAWACLQVMVYMCRYAAHETNARAPHQSFADFNRLPPPQSIISSLWRYFTSPKLLGHGKFAREQWSVKLLLTQGAVSLKHSNKLNQTTTLMVNKAGVASRLLKEADLHQEKVI